MAIIVPTVSGIDTVFQWFDKTSTRLAESLLFSFSTIPQPSAKWQMSKLGQIVDPMNVILNGSQYQHGKYSLICIYDPQKIKNSLHIFL